MMNGIFNFLNRLHPMDAYAQQHLWEVLRMKQLRKNQVWLQEGAVCDKIAFIESGMVKVYFETGQKEVCLSYNKENDLVIAAESFFEQCPSKVAIRAVEPTTVYYATHAELQHVCVKYTDFNVNVRKLMERCYALAESHVRLLLHQPKERLDAIRKLHPWMADGSRLTDRMLAAYLGVTPVSLCNFRSQQS